MTIDAWTERHMEDIVWERRRHEDGDRQPEPDVAQGTPGESRVRGEVIGAMRAVVYM